MNSEVRASSHCLAQHPVAAADVYCCRATDRTHPVLIRVASSHLYRARFFVILRLVWFLSSCLDFAWFLGSSIVLLGSCLRCWSSDHHVAFIQVTFATYWTTKLTLTNTLVQFGVVDHQTPKSKVNGPRVHFPYNEHELMEFHLILTYNFWMVYLFLIPYTPVCSTWWGEQN